jgi:cob(I)alamin adenosyltransferase
MKIYTKQGDQGKTSLIGGRRVPKNDIKIETYGTVDELNSWIGLLRDQQIAKKYIDQLLEIQDRLFTAGSLLAAEDGHKMQLPELDNKDVSFLEESIDKMNENLPEMRSFVLPGGHQTVSYCHIARCVCRRAERLCVALNQVENNYGLIMQYLNRLSDYLFVLSRALTSDLEAKEIPWKPRV